MREAIVYHSDIEGGRARGLCRLSAPEISITTGQGIYSNRLDTANLSLGGADNHMVYFRWQKEEPVFCVTDLGIIDDLEKERIPHIDSQLKSIKKKKTKSSIYKYAGMAIMVATLVGLPLFVFGFGIDLAVKVLPTSIDTKLGEMAFEPAIAQIAGNGVEVKDPQIEKAINKIVNRLTADIGDKPFKYEVRIIQSPITNAFALPGGKIAILTGLIESAETANEVAGVLAHEISHVTNRHGMKQMVRTAGTLLIVQAVLGDAGALADFILRSAANLAGLQFSRTMEREADEDGFKLLTNSKLSPAGLITFFEKIKEKEGDRSKWLSSHPLTDERIAFLKKKLATAELDRTDKLDINWKLVRRRVKNLKGRQK